MQVFKRRIDRVTYNSELNPGLCAQYEEGVITDCEGASILVVILLHWLQDLL